jgi:hypothetical protein
VTTYQMFYPMLNFKIVPKIFTLNDRKSFLNTYNQIITTFIKNLRVQRIIIIQNFILRINTRSQLSRIPVSTSFMMRRHVSSSQGRAAT